MDGTETNEFSLHTFFFVTSFSFVLFSLILWFLGSSHVTIFICTSIITLVLGLLTFIITYSLKTPVRENRNKESI